ncbi:TorF family putative porin [Pandoraea terrae]
MVGWVFFGALAASAGAMAQSTDAAPAAAPAAAAPAEPFSVTANVGLFSDYRFRGISQTAKRPAIQGGFDVAHESGLYAGVWASNISWLSDGNPAVSAPIEMDIYGGWKKELIPDWTFDFGGLQYYYPGTYPSGTFYPRPHTFELYAAVSWKTITLKYSHTLTRLFGLTSPTGKDTDGSGYLDLTGTYDTGFWGLGLVGHVGHQWVHNFGAASYTDWKIGVTKDLGKNFSVSLSYIDTNADKQFYTAANSGKVLSKATVVAGLSKTF